MILTDTVFDFNGLTLKSNTTFITAQPYKRQEIVIGCFLSILGNLMISVSLNIQKHVHLKNLRVEVQIHYSKLPLWWLGLGLMILGEVGNFVAFGLAPASMVAPLATTTVIANMIIAVAFLKEKLRPEDLFGTTLALIGACLIVNFSAKTQLVLTSAHLTQLLKRTPFIVYFCIETVVFIVLMVLHFRFNVDNLLVLLGICAISASVTVITAKGVSSLLSLIFRGQNEMLYPIIYIYTILMFASGILQVIFLNKAMQIYYSTVVVPTNFVFFTISAITAGIMYYREFNGSNSIQIFMFTFGCVLSCIGVYFIQLNRVDPIEIKEDISSEDNTEMNTSTSTVNTNDGVGWLENQVKKERVQPEIKPQE